jgi:hypothetical protein
MKIPLYKDGAYVGHRDVPEYIIDMAFALSVYMGSNDVTQVHGIGPVANLQRQLAEVTRERDTLKAMVDLHDAMNDRRRAQANETPFKRRTYENG